MFFPVAFITITLAILYGLLMLYFYRGWTLLEVFNPPPRSVSNPRSMSSQTGTPDTAQTGTPRFTIIIPARNEEENIIPCLGDIVNQDYPSTDFEIIVVDDFSEDRTAELVQKFILDYKDNQISLIRLVDIEIEEQNSFKKLAITKAIEKSRFNWIVTSDADCRHGAKWLSVLASFIDSNNPDMVSCPVSYHNCDGFFRRGQALEFSGLIGIGAASIANGSPNMCNGANLAYRKEVFYEVDGFKGFDNIASGDDEFLMHKFHAHQPGKVSFLKHPDAIAFTNPCASFSEFIRQRKRWVSKSRLYHRSSITAILAGAWVFHFFLLFTLLAGFWFPMYFVVFGVAMGIKLLLEYVLLRDITVFFNKRKNLDILIPSALLYIAYVLFIGIYGNFGRYEWKGRRGIR